MRFRLVARSRAIHQRSFAGDQCGPSDNAYSFSEYIPWNAINIQTLPSSTSQVGCGYLHVAMVWNFDLLYFLKTRYFELNIYAIVIRENV